MLPSAIVSGVMMLMILTQNGEGVINGGYAKEGYFPYLVALRDVQELSLCGGAIISRIHVLTAGHCVYQINRKKSHFIGVGTINLRKIPNENRYEIDKINIHPDFVPATMIPIPALQDVYEVQTENINDIAIIEVDRAFNFASNFVEKIPIAENFPRSRIYCRFAGWGVTDFRMILSDELMFTDLSIKQPEICAAEKCEMENGTFCAINKMRRSTICAGDSGGPLECGGLVVGIASSSNCISQQAAGFTNVLEYLPYIKSVLESSNVAT